MRLWYDVVPHQDGWAVSITPSGSDSLASKTHSFPTKQAAFDVAVELARKLRFSGMSVHVRIDHGAEDSVSQRKAS
jgi:uncharacterized protein DUF2188